MVKVAWISLVWSVFSVLFGFKAMASDLSFKGIADIRTYHVSSNGDSQSYLKGGYGKFRYDTGNGIALAQLGLQLKYSLTDYWSATVVGNAFADRGNNAIGLTEAYVHYKGLPTKNGWRLQSKIGVFYPKVSMENVATAWSTPYTLTSSSLNNWVGEELRNTGLNVSIDKLGKVSNSPHSFSVDFSLFQNNDPAGAMLTWHGWTIGSRQTLLQEKLAVQDFPARNTTLSAQAANSDPFKELDNRWGTHLSANWRFDNKLHVNAGYYDNHAEEGVVENGQYTWTTEFTHLGIKYKFAKQWELIGQYMQGITYMLSPTGYRVVDNDYDNAFLMIRTWWDKHHIALRAERFNVDDLDDTWGDNNYESGDAVTLAYRYKLSRQSFLMTEYNWVQSNRPSRYYVHQPVDLIEKQVQFAYRYYF